MSNDILYHIHHRPFEKSNVNGVKLHFLDHKDQDGPKCVVSAEHIKTSICLLRASYQNFEDLGVHLIEDLQALDENYVLRLLLHALVVVEMHGMQKPDTIVDRRTSQRQLLEYRLQVDDRLLLCMRLLGLLLDSLDLFLDVIVVLGHMVQFECIEDRFTIEYESFHVLALTPSLFDLYDQRRLPGGK